MAIQHQRSNHGQHSLILPNPRSESYRNFTSATAGYSISAGYLPRESLQVPGLELVSQFLIRVNQPTANRRRINPRYDHHLTLIFLVGLMSACVLDAVVFLKLT